jgi:hypothetical protein
MWKVDPGIDFQEVRAARYSSYYVGMRILFSSALGRGHLLPLLPLARAFRQAGHDVAVLTSGPMRHLVESEAVDVLVAGPSRAEVLGEIQRRADALIARDFFEVSIVNGLTQSPPTTTGLDVHNNGLR